MGLAHSALIGEISKIPFPYICKQLIVVNIMKLYS